MRGRGWLAHILALALNNPPVAGSVEEGYAALGPQDQAGVGAEFEAAIAPDNALPIAWRGLALSAASVNATARTRITATLADAFGELARGLLDWYDAGRGEQTDLVALSRAEGHLRRAVERGSKLALAARINSRPLVL